MLRRTYIEAWPEDEIYETLAWDLPGLKRKRSRRNGGPVHRAKT